MEWTWIILILQLIFLEGILSIDNAAVLGAMVTPLSATEPIPWPRWLTRVGHRLDPLLGHQRMAALKVGLLGAYLGRGLMLFTAHFLLENMWLQLIGGGYLIYLALEFLAKPQDGDDSGSDRNLRVAQRGFWGVVLAVELADLAFSLDNVVAAVALSKEIWVVLIGVGLGILTMRFAAGIFSKLIEREPILESVAYVIVLTIGLRLFTEHFTGIELHPMTQFGISIGTIVLGVIYARWSPLNWALRPIFRGVRKAMAGILDLGHHLLVRPTEMAFSIVASLGRSK